MPCSQFAPLRVEWRHTGGNARDSSWLKHEEDPEPEKADQYLRWRGLRKRQKQTRAARRQNKVTEAARWLAVRETPDIFPQSDDISHPRRKIIACEAACFNRRPPPIIPATPCRTMSTYEVPGEFERDIRDSGLKGIFLNQGSISAFLRDVGSS
jgi:hypothetical protein